MNDDPIDAHANWKHYQSQVFGERAKKADPWAHNSAKHHAWKAYVAGAMQHGSAFTLLKQKELKEEAEAFVNSLNWSFLDE